MPRFFPSFHEMPSFFGLWNKKKRRDSTQSTQTMLSHSENGPSLILAAFAEFVGTFILVVSSYSVLIEIVKMLTENTV